MKNLLEVVKANKKAIIKRGLIIGASIAGLVLVGGMLSKDDVDLDDMVEDEADRTIELEGSEVTITEE